MRISDWSSDVCFPISASHHARGEMQLNEMSRIAGRQRYSSPVMQERRRRILAEARALLAEAGEPGFNIRELSRRAGVSSRTLYHAFGGRDGILGHAIAEHIEALREEWAANPDRKSTRLNSRH